MLALSLQTEIQSLKATVVHFMAGPGRKKFRKGNDKISKTLSFMRCIYIFLNTWNMMECVECTSSNFFLTKKTKTTIGALVPPPPPPPPLAPLLLYLAST